MKIYAPVKDANGIYASVRFVNGVGETSNPALVAWFKKHNYRIEDEREVPREKCEDMDKVPYEKCENIGEVPSEECDTPNFDAMTPNELRDWAKANGLGSVIKNTRNKEKLLELIRG